MKLKSEDVMRLAAVIPVIRIDTLEQALPMARALVAGGLPALEVTLRTPVALDAIALIARGVPDAVVGAGTVRTPAQLDAAVSAGARFAVSPGLTRELAAAARSAPISLLPGVGSASEVMAAMDDGFDRLKLFPATEIGGPRLVRALAGPFPEVRFCPTGGIDLASAPSWLALPNVLCVGGSWMLPPDRVAAGDWATIERLAREAAALRPALK
ncbi:bifunctional 4-hydroxy-2-oxoglutarate aldolase/2-dehydro-3-deoxy-phosphogluconate aldolase [Niveibacterium sp. COAC-50]|uniref:bifunctional 4-hydroxy-2-oxoglutarate aldolase/2-dehydro-3-deoxy-phosphogluconate aldolase n=1 Tax=Niveibacterium sp. COAC-50 TaxID=2729384 RepID=UPI0015532F29|nr:bifunctional 4-hydroxy-2-oxoglutarate aldolase/2-dehydro-3-deoxy-phosphogluconate aldolase [Niveibacterium sp. COAC-50]